MFGKTAKYAGHLKEYDNALSYASCVYGMLLNAEVLNRRNKGENILAKFWKSSTVALQQMAPPGLGILHTWNEDAGAQERLVTAFVLTHTAVSWGPST